VSPSLEEQIINEMDSFFIKVTSKLKEDLRLRKDINEEMRAFVQKT